MTPDPFGLSCRQLLRQRLRDLVAEVCAWCVGMSDRPHYLRRGGRLAPTGSTLGARAAAGQPLGSEEDARLDLGEAAPGTLRDALNAVTPDGRLYADELEDEVLTPFVLLTCVQAAESVRRAHPQAWAELLDELGEDDADPVAVVRAAEWHVPLGAEAELLVLAALGSQPLIEVEAEGLPLSLVRAAEAGLRAASEPPTAPASGLGDELAGALFLAKAALAAGDMDVPVPSWQAERLLGALTAEGLEPQEVVAVLPHLPLEPGTAERVAAAAHSGGSSP